MIFCILFSGAVASSQEWVEYEGIDYNCALIDDMLVQYGDRSFIRDDNEESTLSSYLSNLETACSEFRELSLTPTPRKADFIGIYGDSGKFDFCVMTNRLNVRNFPGGAAIDSMSQGTIFTVDLADKVKSGGYVWAEHDKGWSALYPFKLF